MRFIAYVQQNSKEERKRSGCLAVVRVVFVGYTITQQQAACRPAYSSAGASAHKHTVIIALIAPHTKAGEPNITTTTQYNGLLYYTHILLYYTQGRHRGPNQDGGLRKRQLE